MKKIIIIVSILVVYISGIFVMTYFQMTTPIERDLKEFKGNCVSTDADVAVSKSETVYDFDISGDMDYKIIFPDGPKYFCIPFEASFKIDLDDLNDYTNVPPLIVGGNKIDRIITYMKELGEEVEFVSGLEDYNHLSTGYSINYRDGKQSVAISSAIYLGESNEKMMSGAIEIEVVDSLLNELIEYLIEG